jgi:hypothetical protein
MSDNQTSIATPKRIPRTGHPVAEIFIKLGPYYQKRAYQMDTTSFTFFIGSFLDSLMFASNVQQLLPLLNNELVPQMG